MILKGICTHKNLAVVNVGVLGSERKCARAVDYKDYSSVQVCAVYRHISFFKSVKSCLTRMLKCVAGCVARDDSVFALDKIKEFCR